MVPTKYKFIDLFIGFDLSRYTNGTSYKVGFRFQQFINIITIYNQRFSLIHPSGTFQMSNTKSTISYEIYICYNFFFVVVVVDDGGESS